MFKKIMVGILLLVGFCGCVGKCTLVQSEYYDVTGKVLTPKEASQDIPVIEAGQKIDKPYQEIGVVKVVARWGTTKEAITEELKRRGRLAGADAVVDVYYGEDKANDVVLCGKLLSTKRNQSAAGKTIIYVVPEKGTEVGAEKTAVKN